MDTRKLPIEVRLKYIYIYIISRNAFLSKGCEQDTTIQVKDF